MYLSSKFIKATDELCTFEKHINAPYFRREFNLDFLPERSEITICGLGFYELYINGINVTKGPLAPYISNTDDICYYDNYDITKYIKAGCNVIGIILGNGFRNPFGGFVWNFEKSSHIGPLCTAVFLECFGRDKYYTLEADNKFKTHTSPILFDDIRMGCRYDARLEADGWNLVGFDDSNWSAAICCDAPKGEARLCKCEPIHIRREITPVEIKHYDSLAFARETTAPGAPVDNKTIRENVYVFDFGINTSGVTKLCINGRPGQKIIIRHAEFLVDENFDVQTTIFLSTERRKVYYEYGQCDVYICRGGNEVFIPRFKYDGFRYAYVEGLLPEQINDDTLICLEMTSKLKQRTSFDSSCSTLTALQHMTEQADRSNFFYFPTDCPHREKNGWTGDASLSAEQLLLNFDCKESLKEWLRNIKKAQNTEGAIPGIIPTGGWGFEWGNGPAWDAVIVNLPYYIYKYDGDISAFTENVDMIYKYLNYAASRRDNRGLVEYGLGDWVDPFEREKGEITAPLVVTDSATIFDISRKAAKLFSAANMSEYAEWAENFAEQMKKSIRKHLIDENCLVCGDCQTSQAMMLGVGIFNEDEIDKAQKNLIRIIHRDGDINTCGVLGCRYLFHVLVDADQIDLAYKIITGTTRTCYGYWVKEGYTSLCESFQSTDSPRVDSRNHHFFGDISSFIIRKIVGICPNPDLTDVKSFAINPHIPTGLMNASGSFSGNAGKIVCNFERKNEHICFNISIPPDMHGVFNYNSFRKEFVGGIYNFVI